jgi:hypothetical protein
LGENSPNLVTLALGWRHWLRRHTQPTEACEKSLAGIFFRFQMTKGKKLEVPAPIIDIYGANHGAHPTICVNINADGVFVD